MRGVVPLASLALQAHIIIILNIISINVDVVDAPVLRGDRVGKLQVVDIFKVGFGELDVPRELDVAVAALQHRRQRRVHQVPMHAHLSVLLDVLAQLPVQVANHAYFVVRRQHLCVRAQLEEPGLHLVRPS